MTSRHTIQVEINANNPAHYLACCGIFEIVARFDPVVVSRWETDAATRFQIETTINEAELVDCLVKTFTSWKNYWRERFIDNTEMVKRVDATFALTEDLRHTIELDWWYERINADGSTTDNNSAWKMFSGNQSVRQVVEDRLIPSCKKIIFETQMMSLAQLTAARIETTGQGFGFDPSPSRNALDVGYSPNDLKLDVSTYPFAQLLAMIAAQYFFPHRTRAGGGHQSTRGFVRPNSKSRNIYFRHCMWREWMPILLARVFACGSIADEQTAQMYESFRASRDKYSNLSPSTLTDFKKEANDD